MYGNAPLNTSGTLRAINSSWQKTFPVSCRTCEIKTNCDAMPISSHLYVKYVDVRIAARMSRFLDAIKTWIYLMEYWQKLLPRILSVAFIYDVTSLFVSTLVVVWNNIKCTVFFYWRNNALFPTLCYVDQNEDEVGGACSMQDLGAYFTGVRKFTTNSKIVFLI